MPPTIRHQIFLDHGRVQTDLLRHMTDDQLADILEGFVRDVKRPNLARIARRSIGSSPLLWGTQTHFRNACSPFFIRFHARRPVDPIAT